jgi:cytochrome P450
VLVADLDIPQFAHFDPDLRGPRFHQVMRDLAAQGWIAKHEMGYVVLDRESSDFFLRSRSTTFPGQMVAEVFGVQEGPLREQIDRNILHVNGPDHARLRGLVNHAFTPKAADAWRPTMRGFVEELFAAIAPSASCEAISQLCKPYPALTIAAVMGAPREDANRLAEWSNWIQRQFAADFLEHRDRIEVACAELYAYLNALLLAKRAEPGADLISTLIAAREGSDRLSDVELVNLVLNVLVGGVDTTQSQLAHALRLFAEHPDQWALLAAEPERVGAAVDEVLRYEPITPFTARICLEDLEFRDVSFPKGTIVMVAAFCANHEGTDDTFDITRPSGKTWTFGAGIHYCLGANLAKAEMQEALALLAARMPGLRLDGEVGYESTQGIYGLTSLPLSWD